MTPPADAVLGQLERILASPGFAGAERASRFLRYVVERTLAGEGDQLKEYVIGRAVFDRGDDYDPRIDSIVRVEAGRLRSKIDEYYSGPGRDDRVNIQLRRGSYAPVIEAAVARTVEASIPRSRSKRNLAFIAAAAVAIVLAVVTWRTGAWAADPPPPAPSLAVLPFASYSTDTAEQLLAARVTSDITAELARLGTLGVVSHTSALQYTDARPRQSLREIARALDAQFVLEGKVRDEAGQIKIQVVLVDASTDRKIWVHDVTGTAAGIPDLQRQLAQAVSAAVLERKR